MNSMKIARSLPFASALAPRWGRRSAPAVSGTALSDSVATLSHSVATLSHSVATLSHSVAMAVVTAVIVATVGLVAQPARAADPFPSKPVTIVTAFPTGSGPDVVLRVVAEKLGKAWNQRVIVDNRPGGGGFVAINTARRAAPDGLTLLQLDSEHLAALPHLYKSRNFETLKVFEPTASLFRTPFLVAVASESKWKTMSDLLGAAKADAGKLTFGSWGVGSPGHLGAEQLQLVTDTAMQHVPYRETAQLFLSVAAGDVSWSFASIPSSQGAFKTGKLRYLAVAAPKRIPQMPDVPTLAEAGGPTGVDVNSFVVLVAPRGLPAALRAQIDADVRKVLADPDVVARFDSFAFEPISWSTDEIEREAAVKSKIYGELVARKSISLE